MLYFIVFSPFYPITVMMIISPCLAVCVLRETVRLFKMLPIAVCTVGTILMCKALVSHVSHHDSIYQTQIDLTLGSHFYESYPEDNENNTSSTTFNSSAYSTIVNNINPDPTTYSTIVNNIYPDPINSSTYSTIVNNINPDPTTYSTIVNNINPDPTNSSTYSTIVNNINPDPTNSESSFTFGISMCIITGISSSLNIVLTKLQVDKVNNIMVLSFLISVVGVILSIGFMCIFELEDVNLPTDRNNLIYLSLHAVFCAAESFTKSAAIYYGDSLIVTIVTNIEIPLKIVCQYFLFATIQPIDSNISDIIGASIIAAGVFVSCLMEIAGSCTQSNDKIKYSYLKQSSNDT